MPVQSADSLGTLLLGHTLILTATSGLKFSPWLSACTPFYQTPQSTSILLSECVFLKE
uniref:Uncharacterized protein n=1 Tax=Anguilla anguilla TaxID=7936 RepID=A0A0E9RH39_ANGAN